MTSASVGAPTRLGHQFAGPFACNIAGKSEGQDMEKREDLLRLAYIKLSDAVELLREAGEEMLALAAESLTDKVGRAAIAAGRSQ